MPDDDFEPYWIEGKAANARARFAVCKGCKHENVTKKGKQDEWGRPCSSCWMPVGDLFEPIDDSHNTKVQNNKDVDDSVLSNTLLELFNSALALQRRRDRLIRNAPPCPKCNTHDVFLFDGHLLAEWQCRECNHKWWNEPLRVVLK